MGRDASVLDWAMLPAAVVLVVLLVLSLLGVGGTAEGLAPLRGGLPAPASHGAADEMRLYMAWLKDVNWQTFTNDRNPFYSVAIKPPPRQETSAPAPATRRIEVTYRGFFETSAGVRRAVVQVADKQVLGGIGERIVADLAAMEIELWHLTLTNATGKSVRCDFARPASIEVPAP
jgi:hypothetical protein